MPLAIVLSLKLCLLFWLERRTWSSGNGQFLKHQRLATYRGYQILSFSLCFCLENMPWYLQQWVSPWTDVERSKVRNRNLVISSLLKESERQNFISFNPPRKKVHSPQESMEWKVFLLEDALLHNVSICHFATWLLFEGPEAIY